MEFFIIFFNFPLHFSWRKKFFKFCAIEIRRGNDKGNIKINEITRKHQKFFASFFNLCLEKIKKTFFIFILVQIIYTHCVNSILKQQIIP